MRLAKTKKCAGQIVTECDEELEQGEMKAGKYIDCELWVRLLYVQYESDPTSADLWFNSCYSEETL